MKNEVRPIDANATIEALRANFQQGSWYGCEDPLYQIAEDTISKMPTITDNFHEVTKMIPLTMEQLREMDGQPVWVERNEEPYDGKWFIVDHADVENPDKTLYTKEGVTYSDYGKYFTAYAYQPAHIDQEAWKCPLCETSEVISFEAWENEIKFPKGPSVRGAALFCPFCGKPRTPEAWAELEERMGV